MELGGGKNGGIIKWEIPDTGIAIFEWDEDFKHGPHYHVMLPEQKNYHNGEHYRPGYKIPEPWNTAFFGSIFDFWKFLGGN